MTLSPEMEAVFASFGDDDYSSEARRNGHAKGTAGGPESGAKSGYDWRAATVTACDLRKMTFKSVRYVIPGFIPEGLTLIVGRPKIGKSWFALDLCLAAASNRFTLGEIKPAQGDVLYLALEDGNRRLQRRLSKLLPTFDGEWPSRLTLATEWRRADQGGLDDIEAWCASVRDPVLVVIDTLEKIRTPANGKAQLYSCDYGALSELQKIAMQRGIALVIAHHDRKSESDDVFDTVSGTSGVTGAADTILIIKRRSNGTTLHVRGRDIEESEKAIQFDKASCKWTILGEASEVHQSNERGRILAVMEDAGKPLRPREVADRIPGQSYDAVRQMLGRMADDGKVTREKGRYRVTGVTESQR